MRRGHTTGKKRVYQRGWKPLEVSHKRKVVSDIRAYQSHSGYGEAKKHRRSKIETGRSSRRP